MKTIGDLTSKAQSLGMDAESFEQEIEDLKMDEAQAILRQGLGRCVQELAFKRGEEWVLEFLEDWERGLDGPCVVCGKKFEGYMDFQDNTKYCPDHFQAEERKKHAVES